MYENYFAEYYVSDEELKKKIYQTLENLIIFSPEDFNADLLKQVNLQHSPEDFLQRLTNLIPIIKNVENGFDVISIDACLRVMAIQLDIIVYTKRLEYLLLKLIHMSFSTQLLGIRFMIATEMIEKRLGGDMKYNSDLIFQNLVNPSDEQNKFADLVLANEEIDRVSNNETVREEFWNLVEEFEFSVESYIKQGLPNIVFEMFSRIFFEAMLTNVNLLDNSLGLNSPFTTQDRKDWVKEFLKIVRNSTNYRLGIKHGGNREREGFVWTSERQIQFYEMVEATPKIERRKNGKWEAIYIWDYIYEQFHSRGIEAKEILKSESSYESIPPNFLDEAFKKWRRSEETYTNINPEDSPRMFLFRHALQILNFPNEYFNKRENKFVSFKKTTLQKHYEAGKKLAIESNNQDKT